MRSAAVRRLLDGVLTLAALAGAACTALVVAGWAFGFSLVLFKTGSMSPAIPTGSLALVREVPVEDVGPGDVVTVDRPGRLPVTHRIVANVATPLPGTAVLVLQGDANAAPDAEAYVVDEVRVVEASVPALGHVVGRMQHPVLLAGITLVTAALVTAALWPQEPVASRAGAT
jgi:signal peptidase